MTDAAPLRKPLHSLVHGVDDLIGPAGRLEALVNEGRDDAPYAVLLCHPHPLGGGTMHNKVVYHAMKVFQAYGLPILRFNFRGTGLSAGTHDDGRGEVEDVRAALEWLEQRFALPILFAGFSFGAFAGLRACCGDARVRGIVALGLPVRAEGRDYQYPFLPNCGQPKLFISGEDDEYGARMAVEAIAAKAAPPIELVFIGGTGHFFRGKLAEMQRALRAWLEERFLAPPFPPLSTSQFPARSQ